MTFASGELPHQETVDGATGKIAAFQQRGYTFAVFEQPAKFTGGKIRVQHQAGFTFNQPLMALNLEVFTKIGGAPALPDDGVVQGGAGFPVPEQ